MEYYKQGCALMDSEDIDTLRKAKEFFEKSEVEDALNKCNQCKWKMHLIYEARRKRKLHKKVIALSIVAVIILIAIIVYSTFMGKIRARELVIHEKFEGLEFYGEAHSTEEDKDGVLWQKDEQTTFLFKDGNIIHSFVYDLTPLNNPKNDPEVVPQHADLEIPIYTYEVFINTKGDVFLHIEHSLFPVLVDENDIPYEIQKYNGKTLKLK